MPNDRPSPLDGGSENDGAPLAMKVPLLAAELPSLEALAPYLERIDRNRWYSNFGPLVQELELRLADAFRIPDRDTPSAAVSASNCICQWPPIRSQMRRDVETAHRIEPALEKDRAATEPRRKPAMVATEACSLASSSALSLERIARAAKQHSRQW